jgi:predicted helicase
LVPDLHHYNGRGGHVFPLWREQNATIPNLPPQLLAFLTHKYGSEIRAEDLISYIAATLAHPAFTARFRNDLSTPGLRVPLTGDGDTFREGAELGRTIIWLHTFGERMTDPEKGRAGAAAAPAGRANAAHSGKG